MVVAVVIIVRACFRSFPTFYVTIKYFFLPEVAPALEPFCQRFNVCAIFSTLKRLSTFTRTARCEWNSFTLTARSTVYTLAPARFPLEWHWRFFYWLCTNNAPVATIDAADVCWISADFNLHTHKHSQHSHQYIHKSHARSLEAFQYRLNTRSLHNRLDFPHGC